MMLLMYESSRVKSSLERLWWEQMQIHSIALFHYTRAIQLLAFPHYCKHVVSTDDRDELNNNINR